MDLRRATWSYSLPSSGSLPGVSVAVCEVLGGGWAQEPAQEPDQLTAQLTTDEHSGAMRGRSPGVHVAMTLLSSPSASIGSALEDEWGAFPHAPARRQVARASPTTA